MIGSVFRKYVNRAGDVMGDDKEINIPELLKDRERVQGEKPFSVRSASTR